MFEKVSVKMLQRAMLPKVTYGRHILADTLRQTQVTYNADTFIILTQPEAWAIARVQFSNIDPRRVIYLRSMEQDELFSTERALPRTDIVMGIGGGQAMDAAKYVAYRRDIHLILAPTVVSVDAGVTNTIAVREGHRVRYIGFVVADAIPLDFEVITQAPKPLNRAGIGDLLSIHTALWDWQRFDETYDAGIAEEVSTILLGLDRFAEAIASCSDDALRFIMDSYIRVNTLCLQLGSSRPEEGPEHYLGYNIEYLTGRGYIHGQLISLCTYAMAQLQDNRPEWVRSLIERSECPWRLSQLGISHEEFVQALLNLREYAQAEDFPLSIITHRRITETFADKLAHECERR